MIYLSQLTLNPRSRMAQSESHNPYQLHRTLMQGFGDNVKREDANLLHRLEINSSTGALTLLAQSTVEPDWGALTEAGQGHYLLSPPKCKSVDLHLENGRALRFRLVANPTVKKVRRAENGARKNSNRVPMLCEACQLSWLYKKARQHGFKIMDAYVSQSTTLNARKQAIKLFTAQFDGLLEITDSDKFADALQSGIGPAKAFGCGLLSLAPA